MRVLIFLSVFIIMPFAAQAGEVVACGVPAPAEMDTEISADYCDIHQRRLAYRDEAMKHHEQIQERRENYIAPHNQAKQQYEANIDTLNASRGGQAE